ILISFPFALIELRDCTNLSHNTMKIKLFVGPKTFANFTTMEVRSKVNKSANQISSLETHSRCDIFKSNEKYLLTSTYLTVKTEFCSSNSWTNCRSYINDKKCS
ncbi:unnamed protein product, partial [Owenia fusiformis]